MSSTLLVWGRDLKEAVWHRAAEDQKQKQYRASWRERVENVRLQWIDAMRRFCCGFNDYVMIHFIIIIISMNSSANTTWSSMYSSSN